MAVETEAAGRAPAEQREWEQRSGRLAAAFAFLSAALSIAATVFQAVNRGRDIDGEAEFLRYMAANKSEELIGTVLGAAAILLLIPVLLYLYRVTRYRRPAVLQAAAVLAVVGPIALAVVQILFHLERVDAADQFLASGPQTDKRGEDLLRDGAAGYLGVGWGANIALGFALVVISLNAMRAGILSRFMGILGIILGALYVLPLGPTPIIQFFWFTALGALFLDRWPGGRGPAWDALAEVPWPTAAQVAEHRRRAEEGELPADGPEPEEAPAAKSSQRSRKKRR